jgi:hypothetical protein
VEVLEVESQLVAWAGRVVEVLEVLQVLAVLEVEEA